MSHTPGPWEVKHRKFAGEDATFIIAVDSAQTDTDAICLLPAVQSGRWTQAELDANGKLIAAAPDLLAVSQMLIELDDCNNQHDRLAAFDAKHDIKPEQGRYSFIFAAHRDAIAKATG